ncbi:MAG: NAD(P)-binding domain-containing protein [Candidatus Eremiobacteraeota bacterium]|nr:NAD(P)-binding domain-containing protein [Candidatus Eremiobacteraeota bacterium]MBC5826675.1 NAD(P)-binding domain-containing protein [Candidatus Eremiobacteraeota bacterium]
MKILFCDEGYEESRVRLAPLLPGWEIAACARTDVADNVGGADVVVPYFAAVTADVLQRGHFGLVQQFGVGLDSVDVEAATGAGVWVARIPSDVSGNADSVADHALLLMLMLSRRIRDCEAALVDRRLGEPAGSALRGKTACIVGLGNVGKALARRLAACRMNVIAVRRRPEEDGRPKDVDAVYRIDHLHAALSQADYVILCVNHAAQSRHLFDVAAFAALKPGAYLINIARGALVDSDALLAAFESGTLSGAGLDVFEGEPVDPRHPIFGFNAIVTPHVAGVTDDSYSGIATAFATNVRRYAVGKAPRYAINRPAAPRGLTPKG